MKKDYELNAEVRKILVEFWTDLSVLYYKVVGQVLIMEGILKKKNGDLTSISPKLMDQIEKQLNLVRDIKRIRWRLENWTKVDGEWRHMITKMLERKEKKMAFNTKALKQMMDGKGGAAGGGSGAGGKGK